MSRTVVVVIVVGVIFKNIYLTVKLGQDIPFSWEEISFGLGALGVKAFQKGKETSAEKPPEKTP